MSYQIAEFRNRVDKLFLATKQYIFISPVRGYDSLEEAIMEDFPRLFDVCEDKEYISTYAFSKAR